MSSPYRIYLLPTPEGLAKLRKALLSTWGVLVAEQSETVERIYLDTVDGRLAEAGGVLQVKRTAKHLGLIYEELRSGKPMVSRRAADIPSRAAEIPDGVLRERITSIVGNGHLVPLAMSTIRVNSWELIFAGQVVGRLLVEQGQCSKPSVTAMELAARVTVLPVKGYTAAAEVIGDRIQAQPDSRICDHTRYAQVRQALRMTPVSVTGVECSSR